MTAILKTCIRTLGVGSAALLLSAALQAQTEPAAAAAADSVVVSAADSSANQLVVRDAASGKLRPATAAEARALVPERATANPGARLDTQQRSHVSGARGVRLSDQFMNHSVVARLPDGSLIEQCFHTPEEAAIAHKAVATLKAPTPAATE